MDSRKEFITVVIHGRGGQGAVTASAIVAEAAYLSGNFVDVHAYPSFGAERRGAPIQAYAKLSRSKKIWDRSQINNPDVIIVFDESVLNQDIASSLKGDGIIIINSDREPDYFVKKYSLGEDVKIIAYDINRLSIENNLLIEGNPVVNTPILGLLSKALPELEIDNLKKVVKTKMTKELAEKNISLIQQGYDLAKIL
ncbi:MAG: hypothetical protein GF353_13280 [Candidatus Lokiarchaeota archaeon]|nr:hypothetical protein [Candidatus Lokiarchaeota archaeon]